MEERTKFTVLAFLVIALAFGAIFLLALGLGGCSQVQMSPAYRQNLEMTNVLVGQLDARCQAGDPNACAEGLAESAKYLQGLVDAVNGIDSTKGGQQQ